LSFLWLAVRINRSSSEARISLHVYPNAPRNEIVGFSDGVLGVKVAAPPVKGQANRELVAFLSRVLGVGKGSLAIIRGHTSRNKLISVRDLSQEEVLRRLSPS
jgi:uncharacterized protein (TIGR00251 family)